MMGLDPGTLVRALFIFVLMNPLVVLENLLAVSVVGSGIFVPTGIESIGEVVLLVVFMSSGTTVPKALSSLVLLGIY